MSWSIGYDSNWDRDIGYGVPAQCDHPECGEEIDRGLAYVCGGDPYGGERGCGLYFCNKHMGYVNRTARMDASQLCDRCYPRIRKPFQPKPDLPEWIEHKLMDESWTIWRAENPAKVETMRASLKCQKVAKSVRKV